MELDTEAIIDAFNSYLLSHNQTLLTASQRTVLTYCLEPQRNTYSDMAEASGYKAGALRDAGAKLFALVKSVIGRKVNKTTCGQAIRDWYEREVAVEHDHLFGREDDLQAMSNALRHEGRHLICLSGPPRIGKTYLVRRFCQQLQSQADFAPPIWCHANDLPTVESLYRNVADALGEPPVPAGLSAATRLTRLLETRKLLLIIEKTETLHEPDALVGRFRAESVCYEDWLRMLLDRHSLRSGVIVVCRVPPQCLETSHDMLLHHPLRSLPETAAERLLRHHGLEQYPLSQLRQLAQFCGYNPGVMVAAAHKIQNSIDRSLTRFFADPLAIAHADDQLWQEVWQNLIDHERELIGWLLLSPDAAIGPEAPGIEPQKLGPRVWQSVIQSLRTRGFIDLTADGLHAIQTDWLRHIAQHNLSMQLAEAIFNTDIRAFSCHPLVAPRAPSWRRRRQWRYVLEPLGDHLQRLDPQSWTRHYRHDKLSAMLAAMRSQTEGPHSLAIGNLINVAVALQVPLSELDLTGLTIRHADLWAAQLQGVNLAGCEFIDSVLPILLHGALIATLSPDGSTIAIGDEDGRILCWRRAQDVFELCRFAQLPADEKGRRGVTQLAFGDDDMLAIAAGQTIYRWWLGDPDQPPNLLMTVPSPATSLTCCGDEYIAVGLLDGGIAVWHDLWEEPIILRRHAGRVQEIVANPEPYSGQLISRGYGDRMLVWNLREPESEPREIRPERVVFFRMTWQHGHPVAAVYLNDQLLLRKVDGITQTLPYRSDISMLRFSPNGLYLAALKQNEVEIRDLTSLSLDASIPYSGTVQAMDINNQGTWLLTVNQDRSNGPVAVRVWDIHAGQLCWELTAAQHRESGMSQLPSLHLQGCQGFTDVERAYWQSFGLVL